MNYVSFLYHYNLNFLNNKIMENKKMKRKIISVLLKMGMKWRNLSMIFSSVVYIKEKCKFAVFMCPSRKNLCYLFLIPCETFNWRGRRRSSDTAFGNLYKIQLPNKSLNTCQSNNYHITNNRHNKLTT